MSINEGFEKQKRYITDENGDKTLVSEWTSTDTVALSSGVDNAEVTRAQATEWLTAVDELNTQPELLTDLISKLTKYMTNIKYLKNEVDKLSAIDHHPVGSLYFSSSSTDPSTLFGGTWERVKDKFIVAAGDSGTFAPGRKAGDLSAKFTPRGSISSTSIALSTANLPSHTHSIPALSGTALSAGEHTHGYSYPNWWGTGTGGSASSNGCGWEGYYDPFNTTSDGTHTHSIKTNANTTGGAGSGSAFSHTHTFTGNEVTISLLPPYEAFYCWKRTA